MTAFIGKQTLPPRPHLDHLRKQAKARLAEMRHLQPDARLADAQRALAQDYGFASWGLLRAEVRRTGGSLDHQAKTGRRRKSLKHRERELHDAAMEQATHAESHTAFFLSAAGTNIGVLFVIVAIMLSLWVFTSALPGLAAAPTVTQSMLEERALQKARRLAEQQLPRTVVPFDPRQFDRYAGLYRLDRYQFMAFTHEGERFFGAPVGQESHKLEFYPESPTKFFSKAAPFQIAFTLDAQGKVDKLVVHTKGFELVAPRVSETVAKAALAELAGRIKNNAASPGTERALRRFIDAFERGRPNYDDLVDIERGQIYERAPAYLAYFRKWGALRSLAFAGVMPNGSDKYTTVYEHGRAEIAVEPLSPDGRTAGIRIGKTDP